MVGPVGSWVLDGRSGQVGQGETVDLNDQNDFV
jgi:hypothetical protein